MAAIITGL